MKEQKRGKDACERHEIDGLTKETSYGQSEKNGIQTRDHAGVDVGAAGGDAGDGDGMAVAGSDCAGKRDGRDGESGGGEVATGDGSGSTGVAGSGMAGRSA